MNANKANKQRGIGLLEIMLAVLIMGLIIILSTRYYQATRQTQKAATTVALVGDIHQAAMTYVKRKDYSGTLSIESLKNANLLTEAQTANPWGGALTVSSVNNQAKIEFTNVPSNVCSELQTRLSRTTRSSENVSCSGTTLDINYDLY